MAVYPLGIALAAVEMHQPVLARTVPIAVGLVVLIAGAIQFTSFKAHHLGCCREAPGKTSRCRPTPARLGYMGFALASIAASVVPV
jgi:predicted metal-binding membrane protein